MVLIINGEDERYKKGICIFFSILFTLTALLTPSSKAIYMMAGLNTIQNTINTPEADKVRKLINLGLDKAIDKLNESEN